MGVTNQPVMIQKWRPCMQNMVEREVGDGIKVHSGRKEPRPGGVKKWA